MLQFALVVLWKGNVCSKGICMKIGRPEKISSTSSVVRLLLSDISFL